MYGKGNSAKKLWDLLKDMSKDELNQSATGKCAIDQLIILDRSMDLMSVLATQLTYEGLIGKPFHIYSPTKILTFPFQMKTMGSIKQALISQLKNSQHQMKVQCKVLRKRKQSF